MFKKTIYTVAHITGIDEPIIIIDIATHSKKKAIDVLYNKIQTNKLVVLTGTKNGKELF